MERSESLMFLGKTLATSLKRRIFNWKESIIKFKQRKVLNFLQTEQKEIYFTPFTKIKDNS